MAGIHKTIEYDAPIARVWTALTDPAELAVWLMPNDFEPQVGHRFQFRSPPAPGFDGIVDCEVTIVESPHRLAYTWAGGGIDTLVTWTLDELSPDRTRLTLAHTGFDRWKGLPIRTLLSIGWKRKLLPVTLRELVESPAETAKPEAAESQSAKESPPGTP